MGKEIPKALLGKDTKVRLWAEAVAERNPRLTRRVEKYISRMRIADRRMIEAQRWKGFVDTNIVP
jgi:hypothetical protein